MENIIYYYLSIDEQTTEAARDMLLRNFNKTYNGNRFVQCIFYI